MCSAQRNRSAKHPTSASFGYGFPSDPGYTVACAMEEVGARPSEFVAETSTMIIIGLILGAFGIGFLCWALFTLAVCPLPFFAGVTAGLAGSTAARA